MSISRHNALRPFSRDHFVGLFHAQRLMHASETHPRFKPVPVINAFRQAWKEEISVHFGDEESTFSELPLIPEHREKLLSDHSRLRSSIATLLSVDAAQIDLDAAQIDLQLMRQIGSMLDEHIRWEEHVLFPEIETTLSDDAIQKLEEVTEKIEVSRNRSSKQCRPNNR